MAVGAPTCRRLPLRDRYRSSHPEGSHAHDQDPFLEAHSILLRCRATIGSLTVRPSAPDGPESKPPVGGHGALPNRPAVNRWIDGHSSSSCSPGAPITTPAGDSAVIAPLACRAGRWSPTRYCSIRQRARVGSTRRVDGRPTVASSEVGAERTGSAPRREPTGFPEHERSHAGGSRVRHTRAPNQTGSRWIQKLLHGGSFRNPQLQSSSTRRLIPSKAAHPALLYPPEAASCRRPSGSDGDPFRTPDGPAVGTQRSLCGLSHDRTSRFGSLPFPIPVSGNRGARRTSIHPTRFQGDA